MHDKELFWILMADKNVIPLIQPLWVLNSNKWSIDLIDNDTKVNFEIYIADRKAAIPRQSFLCSAVLNAQHYHWYAATRFAFPGG